MGYGGPGNEALNARRAADLKEVFNVRKETLTETWMKAICLFFFVSQDVLVLLLDVWDRKMDLCRMLHKFCCKAVKTTYSKVFLGW